MSKKKAQATIPKPENQLTPEQTSDPEPKSLTPPAPAVEAGGDAVAQTACGGDAFPHASWWW